MGICFKNGSDEKGSIKENHNGVQEPHYVMREMQKEREKALLNYMLIQ